MTEQVTPDLGAVTQVQQKVWSTGDFAEVGKLIQIVSDSLVEAVDPVPGERVLDVACGSGNTAIAAARFFTDVVGLDYVPELLERGRERAAAERLEIEFVEGDAQALPFDDGSFDVVLSTFGAMFAPDQEKTAAELLRVVRPGGRIGMANWVPDSFVGEMFRTVAGHAPPPPGLNPPLLWGTGERLQELFGDGIGELRAERRAMRQRFRSTDHYIEYFRSYFGPTITAFERVGPDGEQALEDDLRQLVARYNDAGDRAAMVDAEYLEVVAVKV
jgi:ubiquinone/menaquinone biosynthesis C-methylase UbiE